MGIIIFIIYLAIIALVVLSLWKIYEKAGQEGWKAIIPIYGTYVLVTEIAKRPMLWFILSIIVPFAIVVIYMDVAAKFGKSKGFAIGMTFLPFVFLPMLAFSDAKYDENATSGILEDLGK